MLKSFKNFNITIYLYNWNFIFILKCLRSQTEKQFYNYTVFCWKKHRIKLFPFCYWTRLENSINLFSFRSSVSRVYVTHVYPVCINKFSVSQFILCKNALCATSLAEVRKQHLLTFDYRTDRGCPLFNRVNNPLPDYYAHVYCNFNYAYMWYMKLAYKTRLS